MPRYQTPAKDRLDRNHVENPRFVILIEILSVYRGARYDGTLISEVGNLKPHPDYL